jgi:hypothetical protein
MRGRILTAVIACGVLSMPAAASAASWTISPAPSPNVSVPLSATLSAVSCASPSMCIAVGSYLDSNGNPAGTLAELWNGSSWSLLTTPKLTAATLDGVSCPTVSACVAVGHRGSTATQLIEVWNGTTWSVQSGAVAGTTATLSAVSCTSADACMAVGSGQSSASDVAGFSELWNGTSWTAETVPDPGPGGASTATHALTSVSCTPGGACSALGTYLAKGGDEQTLTAEWNGGSWSVQGGPGAGKTYPELGSVSCAAANDCEAVGAGAERWNGTTWAAQNLPGGGLTGVSCPATGSCIGVGGATADTYDGTSWTAHDLKTTPTGGSPPHLAAISCVSSADCEAVGSYTTPGGIVVPLVLVYNGTTWSAQQTPALTTTDTTNSLAAVSCSSRGACTAVGSDAGGVLVERVGAGGWSIQNAPNPDGTIAPSITAPELTAVSCPAANKCVAVGSYTTPAGSTAAFAEFWNGTSWSLQPTPKTASDTDTSLSAIACPSRARCFAAGTQTVGGGEPMSSTTSTLTEQWTGSRWKYQGAQPLTPGDGSGAEDANDALVGISCSSSSHCTAVGSASEDGGCNRCGTLAERFNGRRWTLQRHTQTDDLQSVSCPAAKLCVAVGGAAAQVWNGRAWKLRRIPAARGDGLTGVSCPTRKLCVAVGTARHGRVLVERWNGSRWSAQAAPDPVGAKQIAVSGVSCPSSRSCVLVGSYASTAGATSALIERY